ncbi:MAG: fatty acid desaturase [Acidimicrobiales bacterium]
MVKVLVGIGIGLTVTQVALYLTTIYLHRALSHRALTLSPVTTGICRVLTWLMTGIRPRQWVAVHRKHHAHTDKTGDPHSPVLLGYAKVQWTNVALYRKVARDPAEVSRYARDLKPDRFDTILFDHSLLGLGLGIGLLYVVAGWEITVIASVVHTVAYLVGNGAINAVGHHWGRRPYDNLATNNQWLAWLVAGEGLHNNHHAASTSGRLSLAKGEIDPAWWVVRLMVTLKMATVRHAGVVPKPPRRLPLGA